MYVHKGNLIYIYVLVNGTVTECCVIQHLSEAFFSVLCAIFLAAEHLKLMCITANTFWKELALPCVKVSNTASCK